MRGGLGDHLSIDERIAATGSVAVHTRGTGWHASCVHPRGTCPVRPCSWRSEPHGGARTVAGASVGPYPPPRSNDPREDRRIGHLMVLPSARCVPRTSLTTRSCRCPPRGPARVPYWPMSSSDARARKAVDGLYEDTGPAPDGPETAQGH